MLCSGGFCSCCHRSPFLTSTHSLTCCLPLADLTSRVAHMVGNKNNPSPAWGWRTRPLTHACSVAAACSGLPEPTPSTGGVFLVGGTPSAHRGGFGGPTNRHFFRSRFCSCFCGSRGSVVAAAPASDPARLELLRRGARPGGGRSVPRAGLPGVLGAGAVAGRGKGGGRGRRGWRGSCCYFACGARRGELQATQQGCLRVEGELNFSLFRLKMRMDGV